MNLLSQAQPARDRGSGRHRAPCAAHAGRRQSARRAPSSAAASSRDAAAGARAGQHPQGRARPARRLRTGARASQDHAPAKSCAPRWRSAPPIPSEIGVALEARRRRSIEPSVRKAGETFLAESRRDHRRGPVRRRGRGANSWTTRRPTAISRSEIVIIGRDHIDTLSIADSIRSISRRCQALAAQGDVPWPTRMRKALAAGLAPRPGPHLQFDHRDDRRHAARAARPPRQGEGRRRQAPRQARILQSDRQRQGPHRRRDGRRAGGAGQDRARARRAGRADLGQYRHRARLRRRGARLQADSRHAGIDVDRAAQDARAARRRTGADAGAAGHERRHRQGPGDRRSDARRGHPAAIRKPRQSRNPSPHHRRGNLERHQRRGRRRRLRRRHRRHDHRRRPGAEGAQARASR